MHQADSKDTIPILISSFTLKNKRAEKVFWGKAPENPLKNLLKWNPILWKVVQGTQSGSSKGTKAPF